MDQQFAQKVVLIVEDDEVERLALATKFRTAGWTALEAGSGEDAVLMLGANQRVDVLLIDIKLDGLLTGWDVANAFRAADRDIPVVYASGNLADTTRQVANSALFSKPYNFSNLVDACQMLREARTVRGT